MRIVEKNKTILSVFILVGAVMSYHGVTSTFINNKTIAGATFGIGLSLFGLSIERLSSIIMVEKHPEKAIEQQIEQFDERNTFIKMKAKAKSGSKMFGAISL